jgi:hypothetical protein
MFFVEYLMRCCSPPPRNICNGANCIINYTDAARCYDKPYCVASSLQSKVRL